MGVYVYVSTLKKKDDVNKTPKNIGKKRKKATNISMAPREINKTYVKKKEENETMLQRKNVGEKERFPDD